jgi:ammonium transporter Rh
LCAFTLEWALIVRGNLFDWNISEQIFIIDIKSLATADFVSASILILMVFIKVPIQVVNEWIDSCLFCANDAGESMYVHTFGKKKIFDFFGTKTNYFSVGAYFGLTIAFVLFRSNVLQSPHEKSRYASDIFSIIGTIFLFCFWPSFNAATTSGIDRLRAVTNTYVSICASVIGAFTMSTIVGKGKLDMIHIQNSTLASGMPVGTVAPSNIGLHGAMIIGTLAGGFHFLLPK